MKSRVQQSAAKRQQWPSDTDDVIRLAICHTESVSIAANTIFRAPGAVNVGTPLLKLVVVLS